MNKVLIIGRTTRDIELRYTTGENPLAVAHFTLAVDRRKSDDTDFIPCTAWGKRAEMMERWVKKGHKISVTGNIRSGSYTNKEGQKVYTIEVMAEEIDFLEPKKQGTFGQPVEDLPF